MPIYPPNIADFIILYSFFVSNCPAAPHQSRSFGRDNGVIVDGMYPENALLVRPPGMGQPGTISNGQQLLPDSFSHAFNTAGEKKGVHACVFLFDSLTHGKRGERERNKAVKYLCKLDTFKTITTITVFFFSLS